MTTSLLLNLGLVHYEFEENDDAIARAVVMM